MYPGHCWGHTEHSAPATTCVVPRPLLGQPQLQPVVPGPLLGQPQVQPVVPGPLLGQPQLQPVVPGAITGTATGTTCVVPGPLLGIYSTAPASTCVVPRTLLGQPQVQPVLYPGHCWDSPRYNQCCTQVIAGDLQHSPSYIQHTAVDATPRAQELCESRDGRPGLPSLINLRFLWT